MKNNMITVHLRRYTCTALDQENIQR